MVNKNESIEDLVYTLIDGSKVKVTETFLGGGIPIDSSTSTFFVTF